MKVRNILKLAAGITGKNDAEEFLEKGSAPDCETARMDAERLLKAYNLLNAELAGEYEKLYVKEKLEAADGASLSGFKEYPFEIVSVETDDGFPMKYDVKDGKLVTGTKCPAIVFYRYIPKERGFDDEVDYGELSRISPRTLALGTAREFLFDGGAYSAAAEVDEKFKKALNACLKPRGRKIIPQRSWFL